MASNTTSTAPPTYTPPTSKETVTVTTQPDEKEPSRMDRYRMETENKMNQIQSKSIANIENEKARAREHINDLAEGKHKEGKVRKPADQRNMADHVQDAWDSTKETVAKGLRYLDPESKDKQEASQESQTTVSTAKQ
eukprot:TRINITY_DN9414_c0_g2_i1.p1 TRINITY_DN9414_c0_g2~~TRINITY_DN9414_c0_g2_i1.p1  ORF type:complete len:137 (+),score=41.56 TRINITY_DN9414_c0_g2_i1:153-563(+)